jgi:hypothetical protein
LHEEAERSEGKEVQEVCPSTFTTHDDRYSGLTASTSAGKPQALFAKALAKKSYEKTERKESVDAVSNEAKMEDSTA